MFTGIIEELGEVSAVTPIDGGFRFTLTAETVTGNLKIGDSIAINGVCLTAIRIDEQQFDVEAVGETLDKTNIGQLKINDKVNLERALAAGGRFGGHFVQGHVNAVARITKWHSRGENFYLEIELPQSLRRYVIPEGSIAIDGISLTIASLNENFIGINIIPHTAQVTNLQFKPPGSTVNIEVDMIAKYIENFIKLPKPEGDHR